MQAFLLRLIVCSWSLHCVQAAALTGPSNCENCSVMYANLIVVLGVPTVYCPTICAFWGVALLSDMSAASQHSIVFGGSPLERRRPKGVASCGKPYGLRVAHFCSQKAVVAHSHHLRP
eukprot:1142927-Pelagomonas_calceolata.AAC.2